MSPLLTILIAGGSGSGKSTLADGLAARLPGATLLPIDAYYRDLSHLPFEKRIETDFDDPAAIEVELLVGQLEALRRGERIRRPVYNFARHTRVERKRAVLAAGPILVEGLHALHWPELRAAADVSFYLRAPEAVRRERRVARDVSERGRDEREARRQFAESVVRAHARLVEPAAAFADVVLDARRASEELVELALAAIERP
jgi:uridine kinase